MLAAACAGPRAALRPQRTPAPVSLCSGTTPCGDTVSVTYLGADGFLIRRGTTSVLTPPLFSRRSLAATLFNLSFRTDTARVDHAMAALGVHFTDVSLVLAGHSHYDHLLDVPYLARKYLPRETRIVGGTSMQHILAGDTAASVRVRAVAADEAGTPQRAGTWIYSGDRRTRVMALVAEHAPNWWFFTFAPGKVTRDRTSLPRSAWGWKLGEVYAYVIDFVAADSTPEFRIFFQDAVSRPAYNVLPPFAPRDQHPVNVAIVCAGNFNKAPGYPASVIDHLQPQHVMVGHWDDFFDEWELEPEVVAMTNTRELAKRLDAHAPGRWSTPFPGAVTTFAFAFASR